MTKSTPPLSYTIADIKALIHREARRVTSYDVASLAGVSQSAVSRCFKPGASVSKATYARVMQAATALDYTPNAAARSLITRRSNQIALLVSNVVTLHYPEVIAELSRQFSLQGIRILLFYPAARSRVSTRSWPKSGAIRWTAPSSPPAWAPSRWPNSSGAAFPSSCSTATCASAPSTRSCATRSMRRAR
ncbi:LacI family transcriptional regulator [Massilia sp. B-10]|nr:LacI family transcriptional regulator [Massilia sp. B-10]